MEEAMKEVRRLCGENIQVHPYESGVVFEGEIGKEIVLVEHKTLPVYAGTEIPVFFAGIRG